MKQRRKIFRTFLVIFFSLTLMSLSGQAFPEGGTWTTKTPMPSVSGGPKGAVVDDIFYVMKTCQYHFGESQAFYAYDSGTDAWTPRTPMPTPRNGFAHGVIDGIIYTAGGWDGGSMYNTLEAYDPATDTWITNLAPMPTARRGMAGGVVNGILYAIGGDKPYDWPYFRNDVEAYDPATNSWTIKTPMLTPRSHPGVGVVNGIIYAVGGQMGGADFSATVESYDPATDTWTTKTSMPTARGYFAVEVINGILYAIGGTTVIDGVQILLSTVEAYDPATDTWTTKTPMPTARMLVALGVVNGILYAAGGWNLVSFATLEAFTPEVEVIEVAIDIKPDSFPNSINPRSRGKIPVAILTTETFDVTTVDPTTVLFGANGTEAAPVHSALEDIDGDGGIDMILHFNTQETGIVCGDTSASLTGETFSGQVIEGSDSIRTVGCKLINP